MNGQRDYLRWFSIVVWIGIPLNLYFAFPAFFYPKYIVDTAGLEPGFETVWLRNAGLLIFIITAYHVVAAVAPARYPVVAWLTVAGRISAGFYWLYVCLGPEDVTSNPNGFWPFVIGDFLFGTVSGVLLYLGLQQRRAALSSQPSG